MAIFTQGSIMPSVSVSTGFQEANEDAIDGIVDGLERCAGWLGNRTSARRVRSDVQALREVLATGDYLDLQDSVQALLIDVAVLSNSATKDLIHKRIRLLRTVAARDRGEPEPAVDAAGLINLPTVDLS